MMIDSLIIQIAVITISAIVTIPMIVIISIDPEAYNKKRQNDVGHKNRSKHK